MGAVRGRPPRVGTGGTVKVHGRVFLIVSAMVVELDSGV